MLKIEEIRARDEGRFIIIGDVHGCIGPLRQLLAKIAPTSKDQILFVGDLVNKGPDSVAVLELAKSLNAKSLIGNHERRLLNYRREKSLKALKQTDIPTVLRLGKVHWQYLENLQDVFVLPEFKTLVVHAGFLPVIPWQQQDLDIITEIQVLGDGGIPARRAQFPNAALWADYWRGPEFVVYGHTPMREIYQQTFALGIDTGCVYGGKLTAYILPEGRIVQVQGKKK